MKYGNIIALLMLFASPGVFAQKLLKGKVTDAGNSKPLAGATVTFGKNGTTTDADGQFSVDCGKANSVTVSFVGYATQTKAIKNCDAEITVALVSWILATFDTAATFSPIRSVIPARRMWY